MPLPGVPITNVPNEGDANFPSLVAIRTVDAVGPSAANRQPNQLRTRDATLRDRVNKLIATTTFIAEGAAGSTDYYLPRDASLPMLGDLDMGDNRIDNVKRITIQSAGGGGEGIFAGDNRIQSVLDPTAAQDAATKNYVDTKFTPGHQLLWPMSTGMRVSGAGAGIQTGQVLVNRPAGFGPSRLPLFLRMVHHRYQGDTYSTYMYSTLIDVYPQLDGSTLRWFSVIRRMGEVAVLGAWTYGGGSSVLLDTFWDRNSTNIPLNVGPYYHTTAGVALASETDQRVFLLQPSLEPAIDFAWLPNSTQLRVTMSVDGSNHVLDINGVWDYLG